MLATINYKHSTFPVKKQHAFRIKQASPVKQPGNNLR